MYRPEHFTIKELVPPDVFRDRGEAAWQLLDDRILQTADALRDRFGPITVNTWAWGGGFTESGLRRAGTPTGAEFSQHKFGRALDLKFNDVTPVEVYQYILEHQDEYPHITSMENAEITETWLHVDCRNVDQRIMVFDP